MTRIWGAGGPLEVLLHGGSSRVRSLCRLTSLDRRRKTALEWTRQALADGDDAGANLAVRQSPFLPGVHEVGQAALDGLPGWLADSLPDSWGRMLVDRQLRQANIDPASLSGVDRLAIVGDRGPGAIAYRPSSSLDVATDNEGGVDLDRVAQASWLILAGASPELLDRLAELGGSAGGSRPKAWIAVNDETNAIRSGAADLRPGETGWLVKFRAPRHDPEDIGAIEFAYGLMAQRAGLDVAEPRLFETPQSRYFASRRFDRVDGERRHVLTAAAFLNVAHDEALAADYVDLLKLTRHLTRSEAEVEAAFRHACFNVLAHNRDDHLKQYAFIRTPHRPGDDGGRSLSWRRSPAYDLTFSQGPGGEHTLLVAGEGRNPTTEHLVALGQRSGLARTRFRFIIDEVQSAIAAWPEIAQNAGVGQISIDHVATAIAPLLHRSIAYRSSPR